MMKFLTNTKILTVVLILSFSSIGILTLSAHTIMANKDSMSSCLLISTELESSGCQMTIAQHVNHWQQMFIAISGLNILLLFLTLLPLGLALLAKQFMLDPPSLQIYKRYIKENFQFKLFDNLLLAFSKGILHPQIYA